MRAPDDENGPIRVWRIRDSAKTLPDHEAALASWLIEGPFHPLWNQWQLSVIHLRDIEGVKPAFKQYPEAEYEFLIVSLNPDRRCDVDELESTGNWGDPAVPKFLTPADVTKQFDGVTDRQAVEIGEAAIRGIVSGELSPDSDFRSAWERLIDGTVAHYREGVHE